MNPRTILRRSASVRLRYVTMALGVGLVAAVIVAFIWGQNISSRAESLSSRLRETSGAAQTVALSADEASVSELAIRLEGLAAELETLHDDLWPLRGLGKILGRVPVLGDNVTAAPDLVERSIADVEAAQHLIEASRSLLELYRQIPTDSPNLVSMLNALPDAARLAQVTALIAAADIALAESERKAAGVRDGRLWGRLGTEARELRKQEARLRATIDWAGLATVTVAELNRLAAVFGPFEGLITGDRSIAGELTLDTLDQMPGLENAARDAMDAVVAANAAEPSELRSSEIGRVLRDLEPVMIALHDVARGGSLIARSVGPALRRIERSSGGLLGDGVTLLGAFDEIQSNRTALTEAEDVLRGVGPKLGGADFDTPVAVAAAQRLRSVSLTLARAVAFLRDVSEIAGEALGKDGGRRYLVLAETSDELRATGGFVSGAWTVEFREGQLVTTIYHDIVDVDDRDNLAEYPSPPDLLAQHMDAPVWLLRDVSWEPDYPTAAQRAAQLFRLGQGDISIDGVVAITQWGLVRFSEALGPVDTARGTVPPDRVLELLEEGTDAEGREFIDDLMQGIISRLAGPDSTGRLFALALAGSDVLDRKDVMVHLSDPEQQSVIRRAGWDGAISDGAGDRLTVIDSNIGWSKVDRNIRRNLEYDVILNRSGPSTARITVSYENLSGNEASGCESQRLERGGSYRQLKQACYWNLLRLYVSEHARLSASDPLPLPDGSVYVTLGFGVPGDRSVHVETGVHGQFISGLVVVPAGEIRTARFDLNLSPSVVHWTDDISSYELALDAQAGASGRNVRVRITLPDGYAYTGGSVAPASIDGPKLNYSFLLVEDTVLRVEMRSAAMIENAAKSNATDLTAGFVLSPDR